MRTVGTLDEWREREAIRGQAIRGHAMPSVSLPNAIIPVIWTWLLQ